MKDEKVPMVSVVIPAYNRAHCIRRALDSVISQTYGSFEIIVVDDGSIDNTKEVVGAYIDGHPDRKIKYCYQDNAGPAAARNNGMRECGGEYIAFLDSDDIWMPSKLEEQVSSFNADRDISLVFTDMSLTTDDKLQHESSLRYYGCHDAIFEKDMYLALSRKLFIFPTTVMMRSCIIANIGFFNEKYRVGEDWEYWLRIAKKCKVAFIDKALAVRRMHDSNTPKAMYFQGVVDLLTDFISEDWCDRKQRDIFLKNLRECEFALGYYHFTQSRYSDSINWFWRSFLRGCGIKPILYILVAVLPPALVNFLKRHKRKIISPFGISGNPAHSVSSKYKEAR